MDRPQADAVNNALREPSLNTQHDQRRRRDAEQRSLALRRVAAGCALVGIGVGAAIAHYTADGLARGIIWGGITAGALGWTAAWWRDSRRNGPIIAGKG